jgi:glucose/mannose transport system substrate-binding protein
LPNSPRLFDATGNKWVDGAIAGGGGTARPVMISRITGGDPMAATQFNHGRQAEELVEAGLMLDLTELAEKEGWKDIVNPPSLLDSCTLDGRIYCVPVNIHSPGSGCGCPTRRLRMPAFLCPTNWDEFVAAAPKLREAGIQIPLALGQQPWQSNLLFGAVTDRVSRVWTWKQVNRKGRRCGRGRRWPRSSRPHGRRPRDGRWLQRAGLEPGHQHGDHRQPPAARSWATGRRASSRSAIRWRARITPACRASA